MHAPNNHVISLYILGSYIHSVAPDSSSSSTSQKSSQIQGTGFMAGVVIGVAAGAFVLSALVSRKHRIYSLSIVASHKIKPRSLQLVTLFLFYIV